MPLINLFTIIFVAISGYYLVLKNPTISEQFHHYYDQAAEEFKKFSLNDLSDLGSFELPFDGSAPANTTEVKELIPEGQPGPLTKITPVTTPSVPVTPFPGQSQQAGLKLTVAGIISATNQERAKQSAGSLTESQKLDASAQVKAEDMLKRHYFEHTSPDGKTISDLVSAQSYGYIKIGENLALGNFVDDADVVTAWMNSPGHRANILDAAFTEMGVGVAYGMYDGRMVYVAVQHFGRPLSTCPTINESLKARVEQGQANLTELEKYLQSLKMIIDEGRSNSQNMDSTVDIYNQGVDKYQADFKTIDTLRVQYNAEVAAFNKCAGTK